MSKFGNVTRNALRGGNLRVMLQKVRRRMESDTRHEAVAWASSRAVSIDEWCRAADDELWSEVQDDMGRLADDARARLALAGENLGGGGAYPLLAFLVRKLVPDVVVETGVAAGWSSRAVLESLEANGHGVLYSSDFPYFRLASPEQYVGLVVPDELREGWHLDLSGDEVALPKIKARVERIDLLHYDSDKSYAGRRFAFDCLGGLLRGQSAVLMDDIQDNMFFADWVENQDHEPIVFEFQGKYLGAVGLPSVG